MMYRIHSDIKGDIKATGDIDNENIMETKVDVDDDV